MARMTPSAQAAEQQFLVSTSDSLGGMWAHWIHYPHASLRGGVQTDLLLVDPVDRVVAAEFKWDPSPARPLHLGAVLTAARIRDALSGPEPTALPILPPAGPAQVWVVLVTNQLVTEKVARAAREVAVELISESTSDPSQLARAFTTWVTSLGTGEGVSEEE